MEKGSLLHPSALTETVDGRLCLAGGILFCMGIEGLFLGGQAVYGGGGNVQDRAYGAAGILYGICSAARIQVQKTYQVVAVRPYDLVYGRSGGGEALWREHFTAGPL